MLPEPEPLEPTLPASRPIPMDELALFAPARLEGERVVIRGYLRYPRGYAARSPLYRLPEGAQAAVAGVVKRGNFAVGLLDAEERWVAIKAMGPGRFRTLIEAPAAGAYRVVLTNDASPRWPFANVEVSEIGLIDLDPAEQRIEEAEEPSAGDSLYARLQRRFTRYAWARWAFRLLKRQSRHLPGGRKLLTRLGAPPEP